MNRTLPISTLEIDGDTFTLGLPAHRHLRCPDCDEGEQNPAPVSVNENESECHCAKCSEIWEYSDCIPDLEEDEEDGEEETTDPEDEEMVY